MSVPTNNMKMKHAICWIVLAIVTTMLSSRLSFDLFLYSDDIMYDHGPPVISPKIKRKSP